MMNRILNKEQIELLISSKFLGATHFKWDGNNLAFDYDEMSKTPESQELMASLAGAKMNIAYLEGALAQSNKTISSYVNLGYEIKGDGNGKDSSGIL